MHCELAAAGFAAGRFPHLGASVGASLGTDGAKNTVYTVTATRMHRLRLSEVDPSEVDPLFSLQPSALSLMRFLFELVLGGDGRGGGGLVLLIKRTLPNSSLYDIGQLVTHD